VTLPFAGRGAPVGVPCSKGAGGGWRGGQAVGPENMAHLGCRPGGGKGGGGVGGGGMGSAGGAGRGLCISDAGAKVEPQTSRIMPPRSSRCMQSAETAGNWMQETLTRLMH